MGEVGKRTENALLNVQTKKEGSQEFYFSCQHPMTNQQFTLTTKLSKKRQRPGHSSNGLRRSQLSAQETAKKTHPSISHITFLLKHEQRREYMAEEAKEGKNRNQ